MIDASNISQNLQQYACPHSQLRKVFVENTSKLFDENNEHKLKIVEAILFKKN